MTNITSHFPTVTLLITTFNRSVSLARLLQSFSDLNCNFGDIVVSDDGSSPEQLELLEQLEARYHFRLIKTAVNKGLGNNINKGQAEVRTPYTVYIQEDFVPKKDFALHFKEALDIMDTEAQWDMVTLYSYAPYPYLKPYKSGFSEKVFHPEPWYTNNLKFYLYGDHPHLRRSTFPLDFGKYPEGLNGDQTEMQMSLSFIKNKGRCLSFDDHYGLLTQINTDDEPSTATFRKSWKTKNTAPVLFAKWLYAKYKFIKLNYQWLNMPQQVKRNLK